MRPRRSRYRRPRSGKRSPDPGAQPGQTSAQAAGGRDQPERTETPSHLKVTSGRADLTVSGPSRGQEVSVSALEPPGATRIAFAHNLRGVAVAAVLVCHVVIGFWV